MTNKIKAVVGRAVRVTNSISYLDKWQVTRGTDQLERQLFSTRAEARLYAGIRNRSADFNSAVREYAGT